MLIKDRIVEFSETNIKFRVSDVVKGLKNKYSRGYVSKKIGELCDSGVLVQAGSGPYIYYALAGKSGALFKRCKLRVKNENAEEDKIMKSLVEKTPFLRNLKSNVSEIFSYTFSEILNNAIEHSESKWIEVLIEKENNNLKFVVRDFGIGVFRNIMKKKNLESVIASAQDLLKGKLTTQPKFHSGEGIFFTSKIANVFELKSYGYELRVDNNIKDVFIGEIKPKKGTEVVFMISMSSKKKLSSVFRKFQKELNSFAFDKTEVLIRLYQMGTKYISRSQARRVVVGLDRFEKIILDFDKVSTVGQGFADEVFRIYAKKHPDIELEPVNMNKAVEFMISRALGELDKNDVY